MNVTALWRHPIKSHGREALSRVTLTEGQSMPYDRLWAIAHDATKSDGSEWAACQNFSISAKSPALMAISSRLDEATESITLCHPDMPDLIVHPETDSARLIEWVRPLSNPDRAQPTQVFRLAERGFTDAPYASISLCNLASQTDLENHTGALLQSERWRSNVWFEGAEPWEEFNWVGREMRLGSVRLRVEEQIRRCMATMANPATGVRDIDTLKALKQLGHQNFGVYACVIETGQVALGDQLELI